MVLVGVRLLEHNLVKGVETGFAFCEFLRGGKCAVYENLAARGTVGEGDFLIGAKEAHRVHARTVPPRSECMPISLESRLPHIPSRPYWA